MDLAHIIKKNVHCQILESVVLQLIWNLLRKAREHFVTAINNIHSYVWIWHTLQYDTTLFTATPLSRTAKLSRMQVVVSSEFALMQAGL